jgi:hypothetical protein
MSPTAFWSGQRHWSDYVVIGACHIQHGESNKHQILVILGSLHDSAYQYKVIPWSLLQHPSACILPTRYSFEAEREVHIRRIHNPVSYGCDTAHMNAGFLRIVTARVAFEILFGKFGDSVIVFREYIPLLSDTNGSSKSLQSFFKISPCLDTKRPFRLWKKCSFPQQRTIKLNAIYSFGRFASIIQITKKKKSRLLLPYRPLGRATEWTSQAHPFLAKRARILYEAHWRLHLQPYLRASSLLGAGC